MGRKVRDSLVINNFFTLASIIMITVVLTLYTKFFNNSPIKDEKTLISKLPCESSSYTYIKVYNEKLLKKSIKAIKKGFYKLEGSYLKSLSKDSKIEKVVNLEEIDKFYISSLNVSPKNDLEKYLKIKYEIIENDKSDPTKLDAGVVKTIFKINSTDIFIVYTNFKFMYINAIKDRIDCSVKVFKNYATN